jgi:GntR family transcriptional regulator
LPAPEPELPVHKAKGSKRPWGFSWTSPETHKEMNLAKIDKNIPLPIYYQLKAIIREKIEKQEWKPSAKIPSEAYLSNYNKISVMTVRQAINDLRDEGLLYKIRGKGVFVSQPKLERDLSELSSFTEKLIKRGFNIKRKILDLGISPATSDVAAKLQIAQNADVLRVERLMIYGHTPFYYDVNIFPQDLGHDLSREDFSQSSIYPLLEHKLGLNLGSANLTIEAISCPDHPGKLLKIKNGTPVLHLSQVTHLVGGRPVQIVDALARSDIFKYTLVRKKAR